MVARSPHFAKLTAGYLFPEIRKKTQALLEKEPDAKLISLSIGNTTEPLTPHVTEGLQRAAQKLGTQEGYTGYGPAQGIPELREKIADKIYNGIIEPDDVFISDGAKCDLARLQVLFGNESTVAVQDPAYPVYVDSSVIIGRSGKRNDDTGKYQGLEYLSCSAENDFFPDLANAPRTDLIFFCSPNNPTGAVATRKQLEELVAFAKKNKSIIIYDTAYASFIQDSTFPQSIFEIDGAKDVALEVGSFSKLAGFTGVRLGWTVIPKALAFDDSSSVHKDWSRIHTTFFNSASNIAQWGGVAVLEDKGMEQCMGLVRFYLENARILRTTLEEIGITCYGGDQTPYLWADFRPKKSWEIFEEILHATHIVTTPGSGLGHAGEGYLRFSSFASREDTQEAARRLKGAYRPNAAKPA